MVMDTLWIECSRIAVGLGLCKLGLHRWRVHYVYRKETRSSELLLLPFDFDVRAFVYPIELTHLWPDGLRCKRCGEMRRFGPKTQCEEVR